MKKLKYLIIHCSDTPPTFNVKPDDIEDWHLIGRNWNQVGYRRLIMRDGLFHDWTEDNGDQWVQANEITNGAFGYNDESQHWCLAGGGGGKSTDKFTRNFTDQQFDTLNRKLKEFIAIHPDIKIMGHNQVSDKACPSFNVPKFLRLIGIPEKNIIQNEIR